MDLITPVVTGVLLAIFLVPLAWASKGRFDEIDRRFDAMQHHLDERFAGVDRRLDQLTSEVATLRSDLTHVALAVGARTRPQTG